MRPRAGTHRHRTGVSFGLALVLASSIAVGVSGPASARDAETPQIVSSPREDVPSALDDPRAPGLPKPLVNPGALRSGGPPPDGIPAIDSPRFERAADVDWLDKREPVIAVELDGESRAYPVRILVWHEIVNDTLDGVPVAVTYCPLCNTAIAFDRRVGGRVVDFGTSGLLYRSDLVMYDRQTESLWVQFEGRAVAGVLTGTTLSTFPVATVAWRDWRRANPDGLVLTTDTGFDRAYGTNPYVGYDNAGNRPFLYDGNIDARLRPMTRVVGIDDGASGTAVTYDTLRTRHVVDVTTNHGPLTVWWSAGTASALDTDSVSSGRDVGAVGVFDPVVDGTQLTFRWRRGRGFVDRETGSEWDGFGRATSGALAGRALAPSTHLDTFWFAWAAFNPRTTIFGRSK
ncbi:MAG: DUF3179 domain-containing protein [Acidimicrobiia bacterium]